MRTNLIILTFGLASGESDTGRNRRSGSQSGMVGKDMLCASVQIRGNISLERRDR